MGRKTEAQFWSRFDKSGSCWLWTGATNKGGYGKVGWDNRDWTTHRLAWTLVNGAIPLGKMVLHDPVRCNTPQCGNPDHLYLGGNSENMRDRSLAGTQPAPPINPIGETHPRAKLSDAEVAAIRARYRPGKNRWPPSNAAELAAEFGVTSGAIHMVAKGRRRLS